MTQRLTATLRVEIAVEAARFQGVLNSLRPSSPKLSDEVTHIIAAMMLGNRSMALRALTVLQTMPYDSKEVSDTSLYHLISALEHIEKLFDLPPSDRTNGLPSADGGTAHFRRRWDDRHEWVEARVKLERDLWQEEQACRSMQVAAAKALLADANKKMEMACATGDREGYTRAWLQAMEVEDIAEGRPNAL
jgi:hypothetical protein